MLQRRTLFSFSPILLLHGRISGRATAGLGLLWLIGGLAALLTPALWNKYALIFYDTGGYAEAVKGMQLVPGRSLFYGLFLWLSSLGWWSFWGPVLVQAMATLWLLHLLLRCLTLPCGPFPLLLTVGGLTGFTGISWYTSQLMPDILVPLVVLVLWLLGFHWPRLRGGERMGLVLIGLLGMLAHMSCLALAMGLALVTVAAQRLFRGRTLTVHWRASLAIVIGALTLMPLLHLALTGTSGFTPGGPVFLFGRLVQDGIVQRWLAEHCPVEGVKLCALRDRLPATADEFLWTKQSPFQDLGGWQEAEPELTFLTLAAVRAYPGMTLWTTVQSTAQQMIKVATGDALDEEHSDARGFLIDFMPSIAGPFGAARQQQGQVTRSLFNGLNRIHIPVALGCVAGLLPVAIWGLCRGRSDLAVLALFVLLALVGNAFICGALSNPHDRYQGRLIWLAPLVIGLFMVVRLEQRNPARPSPLT